MKFRTALATGLVLSVLASGCATKSEPAWPADSSPDLDEVKQAVQQRISQIDHVQRAETLVIHASSPVLQVKVSAWTSLQEDQQLQALADQVQRDVAEVLVPLPADGKLAVQVLREQDDTSQAVKPSGTFNPTWDQLADQYGLQRPSK